MMSSRVETASFRGTVPDVIRSWALFSQTSVPWEKPEMRTNSEKVLGLVSTSIWRTKDVPNSGMPRLPTFEPSSSGVTPRALVELNRLKVAGSSKGMVVA